MREKGPALDSQSAGGTSIAAERARTGSSRACGALILQPPGEMIGQLSQSDKSLEEVDAAEVGLSPVGKGDFEISGWSRHGSLTSPKVR